MEFGNTGVVEFNCSVKFQKRAWIKAILPLQKIVQHAAKKRENGFISSQIETNSSFEEIFNVLFLCGGLIVDFYSA
jgi:hypothetical protein